MYDPLYSENLGLCGFRCRVTADCKKVTRTKIGMLIHCKRVHGATLQKEMFDEEADKTPTIDVRAARRDEAVRFGDGSTDYRD